MKFASGGRRLEKLAGANASSARRVSVPRRWRTVSAGADPWSERTVEDMPQLRGRRASVVREVAQQTLLFPATRLVASPTVIGAEDLVHAPQPAILAPNHESDIDTPLVLLALPHAWRARTVVGAASDRFYRKRGYAVASGFWINTFPFDRGGGQRRGLAAAAAHLRDGLNVLLFPQGTRGAGPDGYRHGVAELSLMAGAPIIPVHIEGSALVMPKGRGLNRRAGTRVTFARPLQPRPGETPEQLTHRLHDAIEV
ncbi:MAG TPA: lysophospholipid acyltransferase family protein [Solirubrobacter sp.]|nr:lysophospholipid acyltransferase family protein [Solirubrobacter sp.]